MLLFFFAASSFVDVTKVGLLCFNEIDKCTAIAFVIETKNGQQTVASVPFECSETVMVTCNCLRPKRGRQKKMFSFRNRFFFCFSCSYTGTRGRSENITRGPVCRSCESMFILLYIILNEYRTLEKAFSFLLRLCHNRKNCYK